MWFILNYIIILKRIKKVLKIASKIVAILLLLFIILVLVLSIPSIQTRIGNYITNWLNEDFDTNINIDRVGLQFNGDVELKNIYIEDYKQDTLISITELNTSILGFRNLYKGKLVFGDIDIIDLVFNIKTYKDTTDTNLDIFVAKLEGDKPTKKGESNFLLSSSDVSIYNGIFKLTDENKEKPEKLHFNDLNINATNFLINGSDVSARINTLSLVDSKGLALENLMTNFEYSPSRMSFAKLQIKTSKSVVNGELLFTYDRKDLQFFEDKVLVSASFKDSNVLLSELNHFYDEFGDNQYARFSVDLSGTLNDLKTSNLELTTARRTKIRGDIDFKNVFKREPNTFYMNGRFDGLSSTYSDLKVILPDVLGATIPDTFDRLGVFTIMGQSQVTASTVVANIEVDTEIGFVDSKLNITKTNDIDNATYNGNIIFENFDFGIFLNDPKVGVASLNFDINGNGFILDNIDTQVKGDIFEVEYNNYNYSGIKVAGNVRNKIFDGNLVANDKNLRLNFNGLVDFSEVVNKYDFEAKVNHANLNALNFIKKDSISVFESNVKMNMNSSTYDDAVGKISFSNTSYKNQNETYYFKKFDISSRFDKNATRYIEVNSPDIIEGDLSGKFVFKDLKKLLENSLGHIYTNYIPHDVDANQEVDFNFKIYNKILEVFYPQMELGKNTFVRGRVESDEKQFRLTFKSPKIKLLENFVEDIELQVDNSNPLFNTYVEAKKLNTKYYNVSNFNLINVTVNDTLFMRSEFNGGKKNNDSYNLSFYHTINENNESVIGFKKSDVTIKNNKWLINELNNRFNKISFDKKLTTFTIDTFKLKHNNEEIKLSGFIKDSTQKDLKLNFRNVDLAKITPNIDSLSLDGNVNGKLDILQQNGSYLPNSTVVIDNFKVNKFPLGDFNATITGNKDLTNYNVNATIKNDISESFSAKGDISVVRKNTYIDVGLNFGDFNLQPLNPLLDGVLSNIRGLVNGKATIFGNIKRPDIKTPRNEPLTLNKAGFGIPYLNVDYDFNDQATVTLKEQDFIFNNIQLTDTKFNSKGLLDGTLSHVNLSDWGLDLELQTASNGKLLVLDTKEAEEVLYYGTGFIGGKASIVGPTDQLVINVEGETRPGTVFKIPLSDTESFGDNSFIHTITKEEKLARIGGVELAYKEIKGLELDFDLDVTEDAEIEIIIDKNTGHSMKGRGVGNLLIEINTNGKFNMWGDFSVFEGIYNFSYGGLIAKQFAVQPGGTLAWEGEPLKAKINMDGVYKTQANPSPLLDNPINRSIPVELIISLNGELEQPEPSFTFEFPTVNSTIKSELQYRLESNDDRQNQALYLLSTGSFSRGLNELNFSGTIAERLSGIVNGIFTNGDGKFNLGLNYEAGENRPDYRTDGRFGVTLQTQISDKVLINGKLGVPVGGAGANETVIAGDVEIGFLLNEEGTLTAKVFNRENSIRNFGEAIGYTQGVGLSYNVDFDTFKELLQYLFKKGKNENESIKEDVDENNPNKVPDFVSYKSSSKKEN